MGKESNDPTKYYRAGVAIPIRFKRQLQDRLEQAGLRTVGELINLFVHGEGVPAALAPLQAAYVESQAARKVTAVERREVLAKLDDDMMAKLQTLTPEQIKAALAAAADKP